MGIRKVTMEDNPTALPDLYGNLCQLRPLMVEHVSSNYVGWLNDPQINQYLESRFAEHTLESVRSFVSDIITNGSAWLYGIWVVSDSEPNGRHIGNIKLGTINYNHWTADIGFLIGDREYWGKGIASEAISLLVNFGFKRGFRKITAGAYENNFGSAKAMLNAGFEVEGVRRNQIVFNGERSGVTLFGIQCP
jgi:ribosomal-protein-alanine N-acetyltransferase